MSWEDEMIHIEDLGLGDLKRTFRLFEASLMFCEHCESHSNSKCAGVQTPAASLW